MRRFKSWLEGAAVGVTVVALSLFTLIVLLRVLLPDLSNRKEEIEDYLSHELKAGISIEKLSLSFLGIEPTLDLENVIVEKDGIRVEAAQVLLHLHLMQSLVANGWRVLHWPVPDVLLGNVELDEASLSQNGKTILFHKIKTDLNFRRVHDFSSIMLSRLTIIKDRQVSVPAFFLKLSILERGGLNYFAIQGKDIPLDVGYLVEPVLPILHANKKIINGLHPEGIITQFAAEFNEKLNFMSLTMKDFSLSAYENAPAISGAAFHIDYAPGKGKFTFLKATDTELTVPKVFKQGFDFNDLVGDIYFWPQDNHLVIQSDNFEAKLQGAQILSEFTFDNANGGKLALHTKLEGGVTPLSNIVPKTLSPTAYTWLSQAFLSGKIHAADVVFEGSFRDFPFEKHEGTLFFSAATDDVTLQFDPEWPVISHIAGSVWGDGCTIDIEVPMGETQNTKLRKISAHMTNICSQLPTNLVVQGEAIGKLQDGVAYLLKSPLKNPLGDTLFPVKPEGPLNLSLGLNIAITQKSVATKVNGILDTQAASILIPGSPAGLQQMSGQFSFTENGLKAKKVNAKFGDIPVLINIDSSEKDNVPEMQIQIMGQPSVQQLDKIFKTTLADKVQGQTGVMTTIRLPFNESLQPSVKFQSDLMGLNVLLPAPFKKDKLTAKPFVAELVFDKKGIAGWHLLYNNDISVSLGNKKNNQAYPVVVYFGQKKMNIPTLAGLYVEGTLPAFSVSDMQSFSGGAKSELPFLGANILVKAFTLGSTVFKDVQIDLKNTADNITVYLKSADLAGAVRLSQNGARNGTRVALDRLKISSSLESSVSALKPEALKDLLPLQFSVNQLILDTTRLGKISVSLASSSGYTIAMNNLQIQGPLLSLTGQGRWTTDQTQLQGKLETKSFGEVLRLFADTKFLQRAPGNFNYALSWPGAPMDFALKKASGTINMQLKEGQLIGVEPGLGRIFSLLSLDEWQRRIKLNFSDVINQGFAFDSIRGDMTFTSGRATTEGSQIKGSAADMSIKGDMDFAQSKLNLDVLVTPNVSAGLPIAAAVAAANPAVGAAVWVFNRVFSPKLGKLAQNRYLVVGDFKNPKINPVTTKVQPDKIEKNGKKVR